MSEPKQNQIEIYQAPQGPEVQVKFEGETVWITQGQIADLFQTDRSSITKHLKNLDSRN